MRTIETDDVYNDIYENLCATVKNDPAIIKLADQFYWDLEPITQPPAAPSPAKPKSMPKLTILPVSNMWKGMSSCSGELTCEYDVQVEGFYIRNPVRNKVAFRLLALFFYCPFTCMEVDGVSRTVKVEPGTASWDFDSESQKLTHRIPLSVKIYL